MTTMTKAQMQELLDAQAAQIAQLTELVKANVKTPKQDKKPLVSPCPDYATPAQRVEYEKMAEKAAKMYDDACKFFGTKAVRPFVPVPKQADRMPHSIRWTVTYN